jgi:hypothetical protein
MRPSVRIPITGDTTAKMADKMGIVDNYLPVEFTPATGSDATASNIKIAIDANYIYVQVSEGVWKRAALSAF